MITNGTAESDVHPIARHTSTIVSEYFNYGCIPSNYDLLVEADRATGWDAPASQLGVRQYSYQICSQLGWFHSSDSRFQPFGNSFNHQWWYITCNDLFGLVNIRKVIGFDKKN